jgi:D-psicose/D-tagatose/L-ribulose 3-epimerase
MRFGVNGWVWVSPLTTDELKQLAPKVKQIGFDWLEIPLEGIGDLDYREAARILNDHGLGRSACAAMGPDRDLIHPDAAIRDNGMAYVRAAIDACQQMNATNLVGPIYSAVGRTWQQTADERARDVDLLVSQLKALAAYAQDRGVVLCVEPLNRFETSFINLAEQAIEVIDRVGSPACQILLDTFHMGIEEKHLGDAIRAAGKRVKHIHACENDRGAPGSGHVPWSDVAQGIKDIGYDGAIVIESFTSKVKSIARAAAIWRNLAPTQDALAQDGLVFLKKLLA